MDAETYSTRPNRSWISAGLLLLLVFLIYSNTLDASWHLDDHLNITGNSRAQITDLSIASLKKSVYSPNGNGVSRPLARISLALNWYADGINPVGYHIVNIVIHFLAAVFLYLTILALFQTPRLRAANGVDGHFVALLAAVLWAAHPLQTQAVTYIVQRMASMAAMFYILGLYLYIRARLEQGSAFRRGMLFFACFLSFAAGMASKENTVMLPPAVFLLEMIFFRDLSSPRTRNICLAGFVLGILLVTVGGFVFYQQSNPLTIFSGSDFREFTPVERLLTQGRVVLFYISQIAYPIPERLSIVHDVPISTGLLEPWTTLPSILIIIGLIGFGVWQMRRRPLLAFATLFFFLNHLVESTILSLELIFEHRNYLPSMFVFVPVAVGFHRLLSHYRLINKGLHAGLSIFVVLLVIGLGMGTYIRNLTWATPRTLWEDALAKAPNSHRPFHSLAWGYYERIGDYDTAMALYQKALSLNNNNRAQMSLTLNNMASLYYRRGDYRAAARYWQAAIERYPRYVPVYIRCALAFYQSGDQRSALVYLDRVLAEEPNYSEALNLKGIILFNGGAFREGLAYFRKLVQLSPNNALALLNLGAAFNVTGDYRKAKLMLKTALAADPENRKVLLWLIDTGLRSNDPETTGYYLEKLMGASSLTEIEWLLSGDFGAKTLPMSDTSGVAEAVAKELNRISALRR